MDVPALNRRRTVAGVLVLAALGLGVRLFALGFRVFHWDEARVGYWILQYVETGVWSYRPIVHGPFLFHVNEVVFSVLGPTDFAARLVVAVLGGLLPLSALLYRERLTDVETLVLSAFLAFNPVLLYYSRFMRNDVLAAGFAFVALGLFVRLVDTGRRRYLYGGVGALALAATTKEIWLVYLGLWAGTLVLLLDNRLLTATVRDEGWKPVLRRQWTAIRARVRPWAVPLVVAAVEFVVIVAFFYAPRPDLYQAASDPTRLPAVFRAGTVGAWEQLWGTWISGGHEHSYVEYLVTDAERLVRSSMPLVAFGVVGFIVDRYGANPPRDVVTVAFGWAGATFVVYPAITDISAPWGLVHTVVPLTLPAAVGLGLVFEQGRRALEDVDRPGAVAVAVILLVVSVQVGVTAYDTSFASPQSEENPLVQFGQPGGHLQGTLADVETIAATNAGTDVVFYGEHFYVANESSPLDGPNWTNRFPLTWYLARADATIRSTKRPADVTGEAPVVIARAEHFSTLNDSLSGYDALTYEITATNTETVFFIDRSALNASAATSRSS